SSRPADRSSRPYSPGSRREKVDPWFLKPYEPTKAAPVVAVNPPVSKPKQKLAALLGGLAK
ncbi:MAG: ATP-dependent helicase, partial [Janthinobacterium sp.]